MAARILDQFGGVVSYVTHEDGLMRINRVQQLDSLLDAVKQVPDAQQVRGKNRHWLGTVPLIIAEQWAKDCGAAVGTKEWGAYARRKLKDGTWRKLTANA